MGHLPLGDFMFSLELLVEHMSLRDLVNFGACSNKTHIASTKAANALIMTEFKGVHLRKMPCPSTPYWAQVKEASRSCQLARGQRDHWADRSTPIPFVVESEGPVFLEFETVAAKAPNGAPTIGIVDATSPCEAHDGWSCDLTRQKTGVSFAMAFSPGCGSVHAAIEGDSKVQLSDFGVKASRHPECYRAVLRWPALGNEQAWWNRPIRAGVFLKNGNLSFYRKDKTGFWRTSGIICKNLPERVVACMFMASFIGYTNMRFVKVTNSPPEANEWINFCPRCDICPLGHGTKNGWQSFG
eukprot:gnl/TRDRNA2_/TRDRNA2_63025_c0_seq1.p1 gnl/TRDRNA2_/TRDRNA2_63025_c0~~gnl/TRDRNA2_/TRDRNA2_63025_c0_seq1.p1  ORF type:complete len:327 (-),score=27.98 gnl/TRDRNA2_/TRDRNA2_63025_c0_seq1:162-1055(-)